MIKPKIATTTLLVSIGFSHVNPDGIQHDGVQPIIGPPFRWPTPSRNSLQHLYPILQRRRVPFFAISGRSWQQSSAPHQYPHALGNKRWESPATAGGLPSWASKVIAHGRRIPHSPQSKINSRRGHSNFEARGFVGPTAFRASSNRRSSFRFDPDRSERQASTGVRPECLHQGILRDLPHYSAHATRETAAPLEVDSRRRVQSHNTLRTIPVPASFPSRRFGDIFAHPILGQAAFEGLKGLKDAQRDGWARTQPPRYAASFRILDHFDRRTRS